MKTVTRALLWMENEKKFASFYKVTVMINSIDFVEFIMYRKVPKFSDARKCCCHLPKIQEKRPNHLFFCQKVANGIANSEGPDLGLHCLPRPICPKNYDHYGT